MPGRCSTVAASAGDGFALLTVLVVLGLLSILGLYLSLTAAGELRIGDNSEAQIRAHYAAMSGVSHARTLLRGLDFDDQLKGPDGQSSTDWARARTFAFRNPIDPLLALSVDVGDPSPQLSGAADDGVMNAGCRGQVPCTVLLPAAGLPLVLTAPNGVQSAVARYLVKITDNIGEPSELAADPADDPFHDGDGTVVLRSLGIASVIREELETTVRRNSVVLWEARLRRRRTLELDAALVLHGTRIEPAGESIFAGNAFRIDGGDARPGVGVIDADLLDGSDPLEQISLSLSAEQAARLVGGGLAAPSLSNVAGSAGSDPDKSLLLNPENVWDLVRRQLRSCADREWSGAQAWNGAEADLGSFNTALPPAAPEQNPRLSYVDGDLSISGTVAGAGLLVVTGRLVVTGQFDFYGVIVVAGAGEFSIETAAGSIEGGVYVAALGGTADGVRRGAVRLAVGGTSRIRMNVDAIRMAVSLIPPSQTGLREILGTMDP